MTTETDYEIYLQVLWDRKSLRESHIVKINPEFYKTLLDSTDFLVAPVIRQRIWHALSSDFKINLCEICNGPNKWNADSKSYNKFCSTKCSAIGTVSKRANTCIEHYGVNHFSKTQEYKDKVISTSKERFGKSHFSQTEEYLSARQSTVQQRYNVNHVMQNNATKNKLKDTCIEKYGVDHPWKLQSVRDKIKDTCISVYGVENPSTIDAIKEKTKITNISRYGADSFSKTELYKEQYTTTCLNKYNVPFSSQSHLSTECIQKCNDIDWLTHEHHILCKPIYIIAEEIGMSGSHLCKIFHQHKIEIKHFYRSAAELEILNFIQEILPGVEIITNTRSVISPQELDIFIPSLNLAIEHCGVFYHSEPILGIDYHANKLEKCNKLNIRLLQIFENEWKCKQDIVKNIIKNIIKSPEIVYARNCHIKEINNADAKLFFDSNHIQGYKPSSIKLGLFNNDVLLSAMCFSKSRNSNYTFELTRFVSKSGVSVIGGASKLFKQFIRENNPESILSYCDKRLFTGEIYHTLGFAYKLSSKPNYFYFYQGRTMQLFSREQFQKHKLSKKLKTFDNNLTEWENMQNNKYNRIWDCGNKVFVWSKNND